MYIGGAMVPIGIYNFGGLAIPKLTVLSSYWSVCVLFMQQSRMTLTYIDAFSQKKHPETWGKTTFGLLLLLSY